MWLGLRGRQNWHGACSSKTRMNVIKSGGMKNEEIDDGDSHDGAGDGTLSGRPCSTRSVSPAQRTATILGYAERTATDRGSARLNTTEFTVPGFVQFDADQSNYSFYWDRSEGRRQIRAEDQRHELPVG